jgi:heterodisulfide reductase subunit C1
MEDLYKRLMQDIRFEEGLNACMNCGVCTGLCPAAEYYNYDPRRVVDLVQTRNNDIIKGLLESETIWYCGQCMSCKTRCPRGNTPGLVIMALRKLSQELGYFTESEKGRQQFAIKRVIGENILRDGYCVASYHLDPKDHPEQGPAWEHYYNNMEDSLARVGGELNGKEGPTRKISDDVLEELKNIFVVTGGMDLYDAIEVASEKKAEEMGLEFSKEGKDFEYFRHVITADSGNHQLEPEEMRREEYATRR